MDHKSELKNRFSKRKNRITNKQGTNVRILIWRASGIRKPVP